MVAARSRESNQVAKAGIEDRAFRYSLKRVSASVWQPPVQQPPVQQYQKGDDTNRVLSQPARRAPPIAEGIP